MDNKKIEKEVKKRVEVDKEALDKVIATVESQAAKIKMLEAVADKNRVYNYEQQLNAGKKQKLMKVHLSISDGSYLVGWRTMRDELVKHPTTGNVSGEIQEYEVLLLDKEDKIQKRVIKGYPAFSNLRYNERVECEVVGRKEDWGGKATFTLQLPDGRKVDVDQEYVN